jgi:hypothetical protein
MNVESAAQAELIGLAAGRLHTARSRNDQVATDSACGCAMPSTQLDARSKTAAALVEKADSARRHGDAGLHPPADGPAGHLRPSSARLCRDAGARPRPRRAMRASAERVPARLGGARRHLLPDRPAHDCQGARLRPADGELARRRLRSRFRARISGRRLDLRHAPVAARRGDRASGAAPQFGFVKLSDKFTTGSSIMPQKRNPDAAELVRAKVGRIFGALHHATDVMKGLPLPIRRTCRKTRKPTFDALTRPVPGARRHRRHGPRPEPDRGRCAGPPALGYATATDLADWLVRVLEDAVPRGPPRHRLHRRIASPPRRACRSTGCRSPRCRRSSRAFRRGGARRAHRRRLGEEPHQLWRHRSRQCEAAGQALAEAARQGRIASCSGLTRASLEGDSRVCASLRPRMTRREARKLARHSLHSSRSFA